MSLQDLIELANKREQVRYQWLRLVIGLASGSLSLLVALAPESPSEFASWVLRACWAALGLGILAAAVALRGELAAAQSLVNQMAHRVKAGPSWRDATPLWTNASKLYAVAEKVAAWSLSLAVICLVVFAWLRA